MKGRLSQTQELKIQQRILPLQVQLVRMLEMTPPEIELEVMRAVEEMPALQTESTDETFETENNPEANDFNESAEELQRADYSSEDDIPSYRMEARNHSADDAVYEPMAVNDEPTLAEYLQSQLDELRLSETTRIVADYIIGNIDSNGYLKRDLGDIADDIAMTDFLDVSREQMLETLKIIQELEPAGVGARNLRECLSLQLRRLVHTPEKELAEKIIDLQFDAFSKKHFDKIARALGVDRDSLDEAIAVILRLDPKPGGSMSDSRFEERARRIVPEFSVESDGEKLTLSLLDNIPELSINKTFLETPEFDADTSERSRNEALLFIKAKRDEASNYIKTLSLRQQTLFNVMQAIVEIQKDFFLTGDESKLKTMILKDIADRTGYDLSVISRATASKYVITAAGTYPLKFFFNEKLNSDDETSYYQIISSLREIIENEDKKSPLSDDALTKALEKRGFNIARRTITKYREKIGIPVARLRRKA